MRRVLAGMRWYLRAVTGEARYDEHVAACRRNGVTPLSRRAFERHRAHLREHRTSSRCC
ncbi:putative selenoprotein [Nocardioides sp. TRM66260-LWL]|uniref:CstA-like transporter-associated (seleno)protein n=1 Tax=Nocardioides sp. TRM66260-LWL TaxID=2874478 RepID=UPI001CC35636|nr:CstA-like transporter-associated (seleno)protein [Nocardioides sp. TRM66260-LWL]MBZ5734071.1 putative selenoprotein [Nocardioides sp. TRM66260-LWL]